MKSQLDKYMEKQYSEHIQEPEPEVNHEKLLTAYEIGFKFGQVGTQILYNLPFNEEDDIKIPEAYRGSAETGRGIRDGVKSIYDMLESVDKKMKKGEVQ